MALKEILKKIRETYKQLEENQPGNVCVYINLEALGSGREARHELDHISDDIGPLIGKKGSFEIVRIVSGDSAAAMVGIEEDLLDPYLDELSEYNFIVPPDAKDPYEEFGPCYVIVLSDGR